MANRLADAVSPYLRSHAGNPVDWWPWGEAAFAEAARRDVPVLVSIGYATCHWCHVMARESFSDPVLVAQLNERFVAIKVDREEHPDVDAAYLAGAGAFTPQLGWPLTAFVTPAGDMFYAGTYFPPEPHGRVPAFGQVLDAVTDAWTQRRGEVQRTAAQVRDALVQARSRTALGGGSAALPDGEELDAAVARIAAQEDRELGGFGTAAKFPVAPALQFLLGRPWGAPVARRTLETMAGSGLRDAVEGGFFRYTVRRDWTEPHYERMLYDNAQLLRLYADAGMDEVAAGVADFLREVLMVDDRDETDAAAAPARAGFRAFASAQDSESTVAGRASEGGYYALDAAARAAEVPPALDAKVLTGWNGLAIGALAHAGARLGRPEWVRLAASVADGLLASHRRDGDDGPRLVRASRAGRVSAAPATLEDYGMFAGGLVDVALATGEPLYAVEALELIDAVLEAGAVLDDPLPFAVPGGAEPLLSAQGLTVHADSSEGAYPSGWSAAAWAAHRLYLLTGQERYEQAADAAVAAVAGEAVDSPLAYGAILDLASALDGGARQLVVVTADDEPGPGVFAETVRTQSPHTLVAVVTASQAQLFADAGFELFEARGVQGGRPTAYACTDFACELPVTEPARLG